MSQFNCPRCSYDVSATLADGLEVCPECGGAVSIEDVAPDDRGLRIALRWVIWLWVYGLTTGMLYAAFWDVGRFAPGDPIGMTGLFITKIFTFGAPFASPIAALFAGMHARRKLGDRNKWSVGGIVLVIGALGLVLGGGCGVAFIDWLK